MSFGGDIKSRRSILSGVYARRSKRSHQSALEMCNLSWTPHSSLEKDNFLNHSCVQLAQIWAVWSIHILRTKNCKVRSPWSKTIRDFFKYNKMICRSLFLKFNNIVMRFTITTVPYPPAPSSFFLLNRSLLLLPHNFVIPIVLHFPSLPEFVLP